MSTIYHSGKFEITDERGAISFTGVVEKDKTIKSVFWVNITYFTEGFVSMAFSSVELRAFANHLKLLYFDRSLRYKKTSGGTKTHKVLTIEVLEVYFRIVITHGSKRYETSILFDEMEALSQEIDNLIKYTSTNCYKTQQHFERKKKNATKENK